MFVNSQILLASCNHWAWTVVFLATAITAPISANDDPLASSTASRPNILVILADDLGFSDLGCYGGEIQTPNLDSLAESGLQFTQFYNNGRCWPTRASLLTGFYAQSIRRDDVPDLRSGFKGTRPGWAPLICRPLRRAGYRTYHSGKWHIDSMPLANGFDRSYLLKDTDRYFNPTQHFLNEDKLDPVTPNSDFYSTVEIGERASEFLREHTKRHADKPFFGFLAFTAPHFPLQALPQDIERYRGHYDDGWDKVRQLRYQRLRSKGIVTTPLPEFMRDVGAPYHLPRAFQVLGPVEIPLPIPWSQLTEPQKEFQASKMAIHAAMVDRMDQEIGRVLDVLRELDLFDNTIVFFLSDNGASSELIVRDPGHSRYGAPGTTTTFLCLGPGWSTVANTPFRYHKTWNHEGGIATPLIIHWPAGIKATRDGNLRHTPGHVIDIWPTVMQLAGIDSTDFARSDRPGQSLVPYFDDDTSTDRELWWAHGENRAMRSGKWKICSAGEDAAWELYDLSLDRAETNDLAAQQPEKLQELVLQWNQSNSQFIRMAKGTSVATTSTGPVAIDNRRQLISGAILTVLASFIIWILWEFNCKSSEGQNVTNMISSTDPDE